MTARIDDIESESFDPLDFGYCPQCGAPIRIIAGDERDDPGTELAWCPNCEMTVGAWDSEGNRF